MAAGAADLTSLKEAKKTGVMLLSKKVTSYKKISLINQSVTGIYEEEIDLLTV